MHYVCWIAVDVDIRSVFVWRVTLPLLIYRSVILLLVFIGRSGIPFYGMSLVGG